jgi:LysR family transcriptional regulator, nitrogen assimilation regulatory protein
VDLRQLQYFLQVCDANSISGAAKHAHVSQPALSRQLKLLEEELGTPLFQRHSRGIAFTDAGLILRDKATKLLEAASRIRSDIMSSASQPHGVLAVATLSSLREYLIAPSLAAFSVKHNKVCFRILEGTSLAGRDAVATGNVDVAFVSTHEDLGSLGMRRLLTEQLFLVGHADAGLSRDRSVSVSALSGSNLILTARPNSLRVIVDRALQRMNVKAHVAFEVGSLEMAMHLVQLRQGFSTFPYSAVEGYYRRGLVCIAPLKNLFISWALAYSLERRLSTAARLFIDLATDYARMRVTAGNWPTACLAEDAHSALKTSAGRGELPV